MMEQRSYQTTAEVRQGINGPMIVGYAAVFNSDSENLGGFIEQCDPDCFTKTISEADVRGLVNHEADWLIGRSKSGTLRLATDATGLKYEIDINTQDPDGQRALAKVQRGDLDGSSFSFQTIRDEWDWDQTPARRRLLEVKLIDCGPVCWPAYDATTAAARALDRIATKLGKKPETLAAALAAGEIRSMVMPTEPATEPETRVGKSISSANATMIRNAIEMLQKMMDDTEPDPADPDENTPADPEPAKPRNLEMLAALAEVRGIFAGDEGPVDEPEGIDTETALALINFRERQNEYERELAHH